MALNALQKFQGRWLRESNQGGEGGESRPSPAEINARANQERLRRIQEIGNTADGRRAREMSDVDGERVVGRFQAGELDDSTAARERQEEIEDDLAQQALQEQAARAAEAERLEEEEAARRLQSEGASGEGGDGGAPTDRDDGTARSRSPSGSADEGDEKVIDGVRYYRTMVSGQERWLTLKELRDGVSRGIETEDTLRRAQEALASASQSPPSPKPAGDEVPDEKDLENIILSASMGDEEAVKKLVSVIRAPRQGPSSADVARQVSQQIATQREVDRAEQAQAELLQSETLGPVFKMRLAAYAREKPNTKIVDAYQTVGDQMRKDFAAMLPRQAQNRTGNGGAPRPPLSKTDRKREIVTPPRSAGRQPSRSDDDREVPVSEQIDQMARARGQQRAHRIRRS